MIFYVFQNSPLKTLDLYKFSLKMFNYEKNFYGNEKLTKMASWLLWGQKKKKKNPLSF